MAVEAAATGLSGIGGGAGGLPAVPSGFDQAVAGQAGAGQVQSAPPTREVALESRAGRAEGPVDAGQHRTSPPEVAAGPHRTNGSIGHSILDSMNKVQKGDSAWRTPVPDRAQGAGDPVLKVAARQPGPAAAPLTADASRGPAIAGHVETQPGQSANPGFDAMVRQLEQVSGQVVQVSVVSKTTGSFTGSLNKLLSSG